MRSAESKKTEAGVHDSRESEKKGENSDERACTIRIDFDQSANVSYAEACPGTWAALENPSNQPTIISPKSQSFAAVVTIRYLRGRRITSWHGLAERQSGASWDGLNVILQLADYTSGPAYCHHLDPVLDFCRVNKSQKVCFVDRSRHFVTLIVNGRKIVHDPCKVPMTNRY